MAGFQKLNAIPEDLARDLQKMLREYKVTNGFRRDLVRKSPDKPLTYNDFQCYSMMLLENLSAGRVAHAVRLKIDLQSYITDVVVLGWPAPNVETIDLTIGPSSNDPRGDSRTVTVPLNSTAEQFLQITGVTGEVSLGAKSVIGADGKDQLLAPARWRVRWPSKEDAQSISGGHGPTYLVRAEQTLLAGTDKVRQVVQTIPTGWDTPLRAGAICETVKGDNGVFKVIGAEARFWYGTTIISEDV